MSSVGFADVAVQSAGSSCVMSRSQADLVQICLAKFKANECDKFQFEGETANYLITCNPEELETSNNDEFFSLVESCGGGIKKSITDLIEKTPENMAHAYQFAKDTLNGTFEAKKAKETADRAVGCEAKYGETLRDVRIKANTPGPNKEANRKKLVEYTGCVYGVNIDKTAYDYASEFTKGTYDEVRKFAGCYKKQYQAQVACAVTASFAVGGIASKAVGAGMQGVIRLSTLGKLKKVDKLFETLRKEGLVDKELKTIDHLQDLVSVSENPRVRQLMKDMKIDVEDFSVGVVNSDFGKFGKIWQDRVLRKGPDSDAVINALKAEGSSPSAAAMREIFSDSGMKSFLSRNLSNDEIRDVLTKKPVLQGYLHEMPGMLDSIQDLENGFDKLSAAEKKIRVEKFKTRMKTNLFHNGPNAGFWKTFGENILPGQLDDNPLAQKFFKDTAFDGGPNARGTTVPKYPGPVSKEGVLHTLFDRMSQGTRGGMDKIFNELNPVLDKNKTPKIKLGELKGFDGKPSGLGGLREVMIGNPEKTLEQLNALKLHVSTLEAGKKVTAVEMEQLKLMISEGEMRLKKQLEFTEKNVKVGSEKGSVQYFELKGADGKIVRIDGNTPSDEALASLQKFMKEEEALNGDPIKGLGLKPGSSNTLALQNGARTSLAVCAANRASQRAVSGNTAKTESRISGVGQKPANRSQVEVGR